MQSAGIARCQDGSRWIERAQVVESTRPPFAHRRVAWSRRTAAAIYLDRIRCQRSLGSMSPSPPVMTAVDVREDAKAAGKQRRARMWADTAIPSRAGALGASSSLAPYRSHPCSGVIHFARRRRATVASFRACRRISVSPQCAPASPPRGGGSRSCRWSPCCSKRPRAGGTHQAPQRRRPRDTDAVWRRVAGQPNRPGCAGWCHWQGRWSWPPVPERPSDHRQLATTAWRSVP